MSSYSLKTGQKTVVAAGTQLPLSTSSVWARSLRLSAPSANAGVIYIGDSNVDSTTGIIVAAGDTLSFADLFGDDKAVNLNAVYVDAATSGDKVTFAYLEPV